MQSYFSSVTGLDSAVFIILLLILQCKWGYSSNRKKASHFSNLI